MSINPLKEFFKRKKAEIKFARAGPGQKLSQDQQDKPGTSGTSASQSARQAAAEAAMKRFQKDDTRPAQRSRLVKTEIQPKSPPKEETIASSQNAEPCVNKDLPVVDGKIDRSVQIYSKDELAQRIKQPEIDDDFFRLNVEDAKLFQQRYNEERARNEILKTSEMRRREAEAKKPTTNIARLRFRLPNDMVIEASFMAGETLDIVKSWLIEIASENMGLQLQSMDIFMGLRPFKSDDYKRSLKQLGLLPATTLTIVHKA